MKIVRILSNKKIKFGIYDKNIIRGFMGNPFSPVPKQRPTFRPDNTIYKLSEIKLLPPVVPSKIICLGLNYLSHTLEFNHDIPKTPIIFLKPPSSIIGHEENIILPNNNRIDHECELAVVISRTAKEVSENDACKYILGYTCFNDVTDRDAQKLDGQWTRAKGYDTFAPIGPWIETEIDPSNLKIETYVNNELRQSGDTSDLIFKIPQLISFISKIMTLLPGDIIATGTPAGVGPIHDGDVVEIKIEKIGILKNYVIKKPNHYKEK